MKFMFAYLGIPIKIFDKIHADRNKINIGNSDTFIGSPHPDGSYTYQMGSLHRIKDKFIEQLELDKKNNTTTAFAIIFIKYNDDNLRLIEEFFFPSILTFAIDWKLNGITTAKINSSKNELMAILEKNTTRARNALIALDKELTEKLYRTPLLLPIKNFRAKEFLREQLKTLQNNLQNDLHINPTEQLALFTTKFNSQYPMQAIPQDRFKKHYIDDHKVIFRTPCSRDLHGKPQTHDATHKGVQCIIGSFRRLGAPFNICFHYDCIKGNRLIGNFYTCHLEESTYKGNPHINIAPNDYIRISVG